MSRDFEDGVKAADKRVLAAAERGVALAAMRLLRDCVMDMPKVPHDEGTLRGSGSVFVDNKLVQTSEAMTDGGKPTPARNFDQQLAEDVIRGVVGFNTPYAARLHEHPEYTFTEAGTGGKYLERKMNENRPRYMAIIRAEIEKALR